MKPIIIKSVEKDNMNTEDDTFRILARPNIDKMSELHFDWKRKITDEGKPFNNMWNIEFMKYHGWTWTEFLRAKKDLRDKKYTG